MFLFRHKNVLQSVKYIQRKRRALFISFALFFFCLFLFFLNLILFSTLPYAQISLVNINGSDNIPKDEMKNDIFKYLNQKYFRIIPKSSIIFFPKNVIKQALMEKYKIIKNLSIERSSFSKIILNIEERLSQAIVTVFAMTILAIIVFYPIIVVSYMTKQKRKIWRTSDIMYIICLILKGI